MAPSTPSRLARPGTFTVALLIRWTDLLVAPSTAASEPLDRAWDDAWVGLGLSPGERRVVRRLGFGTAQIPWRPEYFTLVALARRDFHSLPDGGVIRHWVGRVAAHLGMTEADVGLLPLSTFCQALLELPPPCAADRLNGLGRHLRLGQYLPPPPTAVSTEVDFDGTSPDLLTAYRACYELCSRARSAVTSFQAILRTLFRPDDGQQKGTWQSTSPDLARVVDRLRQVDALLAEVATHLAPVRVELIAAPSGWDTDEHYLPVTCAHDAAVGYAVEVRRQFDALVHIASDDPRWADRRPFPPAELYSSWERIVAHGGLRETMFAAMPSVHRLVGFLAKEVGLAEAAHRARGRGVNQPVWDAAARELSFGGEVIRDYSVRSGRNQERLLDLFAQQRWVSPLTSPITGEQLKQTVKSFNRRVFKKVPHILLLKQGERKVRWVTAPSCYASR